MNIVSFMKPINEVILAHIEDTTAVPFVLFEKYRFTSIPLIDKDGKYVGTLSEGDLLFELAGLDFYEVSPENILLVDTPRHRDYQAVNINSTIIELISKASDENFVPIVNDDGILLGIVTRKTLLDYFFEHNFIIL